MNLLSQLLDGAEQRIRRIPVQSVEEAADLSVSIDQSDPSRSEETAGHGIVVHSRTALQKALFDQVIQRFGLPREKPPTFRLGPKLVGEFAQDRRRIRNGVDRQRNDSDIGLIRHQHLEAGQVSGDLEAGDPAAGVDKTDDANLSVQFGALDRSAGAFGQFEGTEDSGTIGRLTQRRG